MANVEFKVSLSSLLGIVSRITGCKNLDFTEAVWTLDRVGRNKIMKMRGINIVSFTHDLSMRDMVMSFWRVKVNGMNSFLDFYGKGKIHKRLPDAQKHT